MRRPFPALPISPPSLSPPPCEKALPLPDIIFLPLPCNQHDFIFGFSKIGGKKHKAKTFLAPATNFFSKFRVESRYCFHEKGLESNSVWRIFALRNGLESKLNSTRESHSGNMQCSCESVTAPHHITPRPLECGGYCMRGGTCWVPLIKTKAVKARTSVSASRGLQGLTKRMRVMRRVVSAGCQPVGVNGRVCGVLSASNVLRLCRGMRCGRWVKRSCRYPVGSRSVEATRK